MGRPNADSIEFDNSAERGNSLGILSTNMQEAAEEIVFRKSHVLHVNKDHYPGHFTTLKAALDSILDADPRTIHMAPGVYVEDNSAGPLVLKPGVTIKSDGHSTVVIEPLDPNQDLISQADSNARLQGVTLRNVTGASALVITSAPTPGIFDVITISNCKIPIKVSSNASITQAVFRNLRIQAGATTERLMDIRSLGGLDAIVRIYSAILTDDNGTAFLEGILVSGTGARIDPNIVLLRSTIGVGRGIVVDDGAHIELTSGCEIHGFNDNIVFEDSGAAPTAKMQSLTTHDAIAADIRVVHAGTTGIFTGIARRAKIFNAAPTTFLVVYSDPANGNFNNTGMLITRGFSPELNNIVTDGLLHQLTRFDAHTTTFTGTTAGTILRLPDALTFLKTGHQYDVWNFSNQIVIIQDYDGNELAQLKANGKTLIILRDISSSAGVWGLTYSVDSGNVFGSEVQFAESVAETSNNSAVTYATKVSLVTPSDLPLGDYMFHFQFIWRSSSADREAEFRFQLNAADIIHWEPTTSRTQDNQLLSGFRRVTGISGTNTFTFDFRVANSSTTIFVRDARIYITRIL